MLLFQEENNAENAGGFRLRYVEVFNWGTFDRHIWRLAPEGENSLLTGANGSGKTTLVDAIVTLLVPPGRRFYNQSSGAEKKRERDEESYTRGAYLTVQSESGLSATTQYLRDKEEAYSILIGDFFNTHTREHVCLAQVRWFSNNGLSRTYLIASAPLSIADHFTPMDTAGQWKRRLKQQTGAEEFDSFTKYSQRFSKLFGLKSEKALTLFSQTVGIKVLGDLNEFIRSNMLEESDTEEEFLKLREHYDNLLRAYQAIEQARQQLELLTPVVEGAAAFRQLEAEHQQAVALEESLPAFFAGRKLALYEQAIDELEGDLRKKENQIAALRRSLEDLHEQQTRLHVALHSNQVYEQLRNLEKELQYLEREVERRRKTAERYNDIAAALEFKTDPTENRFYKNLESCREEIEALEEEIRLIRQEDTHFAVQLRVVQQERDELHEQVQSLLRRRNRLPLEQVRIREALLRSLELPESELPFAAELIKVREEENAWAGAIEQVLRPLALSLLVGDDLYERVMSYAHRAQLDGEIRFFRVAESALAFQAPPLPDDHLLRKVEIKTGHPFSPWLLEHLHRDYDYSCVNGYVALARYDHGVNDKGLIKHRTHHRRDDKPERIGEAAHVLGWDNRATILLLQRRLQDLDAEIADLERARAQRQRDEQRRRERQQALTRLGQYTDFAEIDWKRSDEEIKQRQHDRRQLMESSDQLRELQDQLNEIATRIDQETGRREKLTRETGGIQTRLEDYRNKQQETRQVLTALGERDYSAFFPQIQPLLDAKALSVSAIAGEETRVGRLLRQQKEEKNARREKAESRVLLAMQRFISPTQDILEKHPGWTTDTMELQADLAFLDEFERRYRKIREEDLPRFRKRFKDWLNERLILDIASFKASLETREAAIEESISVINRSLLNIDFSNRPATYIQLDLQKTRDQAIRDFKQMLRDAMPDAGKFAQGDEREQEVSFKRIRRLIEELSANEGWRRRVTDVRNWLEFAAVERFRADHSERQYYVDSQSLSGGEKAKLAYTILASAIAYQFGIRNEQHRRRSFRFAVIDEAFSKVDPANALYAMELFRQLDLQLMVVTPLDKINIAEPFIRTVHYALNREKGRSEVFDLPIEVYHQRKAEFRKNEVTP